SPTSLQEVMALAGSYAPPEKIVNMLGVEGSQQVMLSVRFVEMERSVAKNLNVSFMRPAPGEPNGSVQVQSGTALANAFTSLAARFGEGSNSLNVQLDALEQKGVIRTLAEPDLVANSGETANFLAGGEFPIPIASTANNGIANVSIQFQQFGVALAFTPTLL